jgi:hypothetical protein
MGGPDWEVKMFDAFSWAQPLPAGGDARPELDVHEGSWVEQAAHQEHEDHRVLNTVHLVDTAHHMYEFYEFGKHVGTAAEGAFPSAGPGLITPLGAALVGLTVILELNRAFGVGEAIESQEGYAYGMMCAVLGMPVVEPHFEAWGTDSAKDLREAWWEGVEQAQEQARNPKVREAVERALAYELAAQGRDPATDPESHALQEAVRRTMNRIWSEGAGPKPIPMHAIAWGGPEVTWDGLRQAEARAKAANP